SSGGDAAGRSDWGGGPVPPWPRNSRLCRANRRRSSSRTFASARRSQRPRPRCAAGVEINPEPIRLVGESELVRGDGRRLSHYPILLSDEPSRRWRDVFRDAADMDHAVSGYIVLVDGDRVDFEATADILPDRLKRIKAWIDWANAEVGSE